MIKVLETICFYSFFCVFSFSLPEPNSTSVLPLFKAVLTMQWSNGEVDHENLEIKKITLFSES